MRSGSGHFEILRDSFTSSPEKFSKLFSAKCRMPGFSNDISLERRRIRVPNVTSKREQIMKSRRIKAGIAAFTILLLAQTIHAAPFTLFIYETPADLAARTDSQKAGAYWQSDTAYAQAMTEAGILRGGTALNPMPAAGPKAETTRQAPGAAQARVLSGYFIIDVADLAAAESWAQKAPDSSPGATQVIAHLDNPTMAATSKK